MGKSFVVGCCLGLVLAALLAVSAFWVVINKPRPSAVTAAAEPGEIEVRVSEGMLSRIAGVLLSKEQPSLDNIVLDLQPVNVLRLDMDAKIEVMGLSRVVQVGAVGTLQANGGKLDWLLGDVRVGGLTLPASSLPESLRQDLESMRGAALAMINDALVEAGFSLQGVSTEDAAMILTLQYPSAR